MVLLFSSEIKARIMTCVHVFVTYPRETFKHEISKQSVTHFLVCLSQIWWCAYISVHPSKYNNLLRKVGNKWKRKRFSSCFSVGRCDDMVIVLVWVKADNSNYYFVDCFVSWVEVERVCFAVDVESCFVLLLVSLRSGASVFSFFPFFVCRRVPV